MIILTIGCSCTLLPAERTLQRSTSMPTLESLKQQQDRYINKRYAVQPYGQKWNSYTQKINNLTTEIDAYQLTKTAHGTAQSQQHIQPQNRNASVKRQCPRLSKIAIIAPQICIYLTGAMIIWIYREANKLR